ncbi:restriction endonuclease [Paraburkholderia fungorum]|uniref:restriction endonuclease n=1 Tax=Paraburkholderia fungorum TaxID=134537 RepID=UPI00402B0DF7
MSAKQLILSELLRTELGPGNHDFRALLANLAASALGKDRPQAETYADANLRRFWNWLKEAIDDHRRRNLSPYFVIPQPSSFALACGAQHLSQFADPESQVAGRYSRLRPHLLRQIDRLSDRQYEALAGIACRSLGASNFYLTPAGNEGGVDFFATLAISKSDNAPSSLGHELRVVGQCKKYKTPVPVDRVEGFLQTMSNIRHRSARVASHIPTWFNESNAPIVGWIISHQGFQSGSSDEAKQHGLFLSDSVDLAEILSRCKIMDADKSPSIQLTLLKDMCDALI